MNNAHKTNAQGKVEPRHVMVDIETMGLTTDSAIVAIGAITFDPLSGKFGRTFYRELAWRDQDDREKDPDTYAFWMKQSPAARKCLDGTADLYDTLEEFAAWLPAGCTMWGNGPEFDMAMLTHAYQQVLIPIPWAFYRIQSCRTMMLLWETMTGCTDPINKGMKGTTHNALDDAKNQAKEVSRMYRVMVNAYYNDCRSSGNRNVVSIIGPVKRNM